MVDTELFAAAIKNQQAINDAQQRAINSVFNGLEDLRLECMAMNNLIHHLLGAHPDPAAIFAAVDEMLLHFEDAQAMPEESIMRLREKFDGYRS